MSSLEELIERYYKLTELRKRIDKLLRELREEILKYCESGIYGSYLVKIQEVRQKRLDTRKVEEFLTEFFGERKEEFYKTVTFKKLEVKKLGEKFEK